MAPQRPFIGGLPACDAPMPEISPARLGGLAWLGGAPLRPTRRFAMLGCGSGVGLASVAAATAGAGVSVIGAAETPENADLARALLDEAEVDAEVVAIPPEAPEALAAAGPFDLVVFPYGWHRLSAASRRRLAETLSAAVAPGGGVALQRPVAPAAAEARVAARLLRNRWDSLTEVDDDAERARRALSEARGLLEASHALVRHLSGWEGLLAILDRLPADQLLRDWVKAEGPDWGVREDAALFEEAGFGRMGAASPDMLAPSLHLGPQALAMMEDAPSPAIAGEIADLSDDRMNRADLFVRDGGDDVSEDAAAPRLLRLEPADATGDLVPQGLAPFAARLSRETYAPMLAALDVEQATPARDVLDASGVGEREAASRLAALVSAGAAAFVGPAAGFSSARRACARLNAVLARRGRLVAPASPALGGAAPAPEDLVSGLAAKDAVPQGFERWLELRECQIGEGLG